MNQTRRPAWRSVFDVAASVMMIAASGAIVWIALLAPRPKSPAVDPVHGLATMGVPTEPITLDGAAIRGNRQAEVVVIEYFDFECPFCVDFARDTLPLVVKQYVNLGKVQLAFRQLPIQSRHPNALRAAQAAECSRRQGKFCEMQDSLFSAPLPQDASGLMRLARTLGLEMKTFQACLAGEADTQIKADVAEAQRLGVTGTPTFFFGKLRHDGRVAVLRRRSGNLGPQMFDRLVKEVVDWRASE